MSQAPTTPEPPEPPGRRRSLPARLLGTGARGAQRVAGATGIDDAVELAVEESIVRAIESEAVERALARVMDGPVVEEAVERALASPAVERALTQAIDSEMIDRVWAQLLASDEVQKLVERIAEAPEVRAAITAQGAGFVGDIGREAGKVTRRLDDVVERVVRRLLFRRRRETPAETVGLATRVAALALDIALLNAGLFVVSTLLAGLGSAIAGNFNDISAPALVVGAGVWLLVGAAYLMIFWGLAGQTPGMRFLSIRLEPTDGEGIGSRRAFRRLVGGTLAAIPFGLGFLGVVLNDQRRGWQDRFADTDVVYVGPAVAPYSERPTGGGSVRTNP
jgi:uncharacterized RDD family membrane protein YckC